MSEMLFFTSHLRVCIGQTDVSAKQIQTIDITSLLDLFAFDIIQIIEIQKAQVALFP